MTRGALRLLVSAAALLPMAAQGQETPPASGLLFRVSGDHGTRAEIARGAAGPIFQHGVSRVDDGPHGTALRMADDLTLAWSAPSNIYAQRGTLSFFFRPRTPVDAAPFTIFRVGTGDSTSWDMTFLRIDWNGHGFDAFVTDTNLARTRVSWTMPTLPAADHWVHIAFGWDEASGVTLWIDGKRVAAQRRRADYDQQLFGFGPFQRIVSPQKVESALNYMRSGDVDEVRIYDHQLGDADVAALATNRSPAIAAATPRSLTDPATRAEWTFRHGWDHLAGPIPAGAVTAIRKVEFTEARDQKEKAFRGADGIRETTWPGVYNRSRLPGRNDYFKLPDWNVYATAGQVYTLSLPDERWNHIEVIGAAHGILDWAAGDRRARILTRLPGAERTATTLYEERNGGTLSFRNDVQETPIQEIGVYDVTAAASAPQGFVHLDYTVNPAADPAGYASLQPLVDRIAGRFPADERGSVVALPTGAPVARGAAASLAPSLPVVHVLIPSTFRDQPMGEVPRRFSYDWENLDAALDGVVLRLPPLALASGRDGRAPLSVRLHDPLWPDRDLIDVMVRVVPGRAQTLWLDSRDRFLRRGDPVSLTLAADDPRFGAVALKGTGVSLIFKPAAEGRSEHVADRLEQARDELATLIEEKPSTRLFPVWDRFERDVSDVLRIDPGNAHARALWLEMNSAQSSAPAPLAPAPAGVPEWAWRQTQLLSLFRGFVDWWIDHRQIADGEFGGGLSDDTDLVNQWVGLALMGVEPERLRTSQRAVLEATYTNGMWDHGLSAIQADQLHSYEEGINTLGQAMMLDWGNPTLIERAMETARNYSRLIQQNSAGHFHFSTAWFSGSRIDHGGNLDWQYPYSFLVTHPGLLLVDYNGAPAVRSIVLSALDGWLAHGTRDAAGAWQFPQEIEWSSDRGRGHGVVSAVHDFWAAWHWTHDPRYLQPITPAGMTAKSLSGLLALNADALATLPGGNALARQVAADPAAVGTSVNDINLGTVSSATLAKYVRWQETDDNTLLANLYAGEIQQTRARWYILTDAELWSDRVAVPSELLQRARMGGVAHLRNKYYPGNLVSWRFATSDTAEKVGILIPKGDPRHFRVVAFNMTDQLVTATMIGGMLAPGTWRVTSGVDANGDNQADAPGGLRNVRLERGLGIDLVLSPRRTIVYEFALAAPGDDPATRTDIAVSANDLALRGNRLSIRVHSLGARPTPAGRLSVIDSSGRVIATAAFPPLAAPAADLQPRVNTITVPLDGRVSTGPLTVTATLGGNPAEVTMANNSAILAIH